MRIPNPIANTTTEAYLAYKAGVLQVGDLKPKLYYPYLHFDAWLAYWAGLVDTYPIHDVGKNLFNENDVVAVWINESGAAQASVTWWQSKFIPVSPNTTYTVTTHQIPDSGSVTSQIQWHGYSSKEESSFISGQAGLEQLWGDDVTLSMTFTTSSDCHYVRIGYRQERQEKVQLEAGSTATEYEPYTGTPEILTDEEALVAYLSGVTNTYPDTVKDPEDVRIAGYLRYLVSARFGRPAYPVNNRELYLSMLKPPIVTNETPSANIYLEDTVKAEFVSLEMFGDTFQQTYSGKNLFDITKNSSSVHSPIETSGTIISGGTIRVTNLVAGGYRYYFVSLPNTTAVLGKTITLSVDVSLHNSTSSQIRFMWASDSWYTDGLGSAVNLSSDGSYTVTVDVPSSIPSGSTRLCVGLYGSGTTSSPANSYTDFSNIQVEVGSSPTSYEKYVGGIPAPNPDYPQPVQTVTGRQTVKVQGKNMLQAVPAQNNKRGIDTTVDGATGTVTFSGTTSANYPWIVDSPIYLPQGSYTVSFNKTLPYQMAVRFYYDDTNYATTNINAGATRSTITAENPVTRTLFLYNCGSGVSVSTTDLGIQLESGSTATTYEPYQSQEYEVNLGKNLFDKSTVTNGYRLGADGLPYGDAPFSVSDYIPIQGGTTYTYSRKLTTGDQTVAAICYYDASKTFISRTMPIITNHTTSGQLTSPANAVYARIADRTEGLDAYQFEKGSTATTYAPYFEPIELCAIRDKAEDVLYSDKIYKDGQDWYLHKETGKDSLDGSIGVFTKITTNRINVQGFPTISHKKAVGFNGQYCTHYETVGEYEANGEFDTATAGMPNAVGIHPRPGAQWSGGLRIKDSRNLSADSYKTWLGSNPVDFYLVLADPVDTQITNPALIAQLNALKHGGSEEGSTTITVTAAGDNLPGLLKVEAGTESIS